MDGRSIWVVPVFLKGWNWSWEIFAVVYCKSRNMYAFYFRLFRTQGSSYLNKKQIKFYTVLCIKSCSGFRAKISYIRKVVWLERTKYITSEYFWIAVIFSKFLPNHDHEAWPVKYYCVPKKKKLKERKKERNWCPL